MYVYVYVCEESFNQNPLLFSDSLHADPLMRMNGSMNE